MQSLTKHQSKILDYLIEFIRRECYAPNTREMVADFGYDSRNALSQPIKELERKGYIIRQPRGAHRNIIVLFDSRQQPITYNLWKGVATDIGPTTELKSKVEKLETKVKNLRAKVSILQRLALAIKNELED
ncbi:MAG: LexA family protein [Planctomycetota bacterium]|jgi:SOS-response transcriptional repressor LexA